MHLQVIKHRPQDIHIATSLCDGAFICDSSEDIEEVTCPECLKLYIKLIESYYKDKMQTQMCQKKRIQDLESKNKKLEKEIHSLSEKLRFRTIA
jgi:hypothetical protein